MDRHALQCVQVRRVPGAQGELAWARIPMLPAELLGRGDLLPGAIQMVRQTEWSY